MYRINRDVPFKENLGNKFIRFPNFRSLLTEYSGSIATPKPSLTKANMATNELQCIDGLNLTVKFYWTLSPLIDALFWTALCYVRYKEVTEYRQFLFQDYYIDV